MESLPINLAIKRIEMHRDIHHLHEPQAIYISQSLDMAIEALKKQNPVKVTWDNNFCPICKCTIEFNHQNYCHKCGQKFDWNK